MYNGPSKLHLLKLRLGFSKDSFNASVSGVDRNPARCAASTYGDDLASSRDHIPAIFDVRFVATELTTVPVLAPSPGYHLTIGCHGHYMFAAHGHAIYDRKVVRPRLSMIVSSPETIEPSVNRTQMPPQLEPTSFQSRTDARAVLLTPCLSDPKTT